jgi:hypothetical protein
MPIPSEAAVESFCERHERGVPGVSEFREHVHDDGYTAVHVEKAVPIAQLRDIYRTRAKLPRRSPLLSGDTEGLVGALDACVVDVAIWALCYPDGRILSVFERVDTHGLVGFIRGVDARVAQPDDNDRLWGAG